MDEMPPWCSPIALRPFPVLDDSPDWVRLPKRYRHRPGEYYFVGQLAEALGRSPVTVRRWERLEWLPPSPLIEPGPFLSDRTELVRGRRRLYTRAMIDAAVRIAEEEGLLGTQRCCPGETNFCERVATEWEQLADCVEDEPTWAELNDVPGHPPAMTPWRDVLAQQNLR